MIVDGRVLALERREEVRRARERFGALSLGVVMATKSAVTESYVGIKKRAAEALGISVVEYRLPETVSFEEIIAKVKEAEKHDGIILQLPLPEGIDVEAAKNTIPLELDVDVLSDPAFVEFAAGRIAAVPPVPAAMHYILKRNNVSLEGKNVVCVGGGRLVGKPAAALFLRLGANVSTLIKGDSLEPTKTADILVLGAGSPALVKPDMIKEGVVILDGGTSESSGKVVGDADPACADKASLFTPVPGGVGPIAVVEIFANLVALKARTWPQAMAY
ncbi:bifunctional 5,10-methylenetetrahydrofolate dehydrogenase/5,10-methenyltetrahydrofolate cyclohydrolase [Candidatus Kaiserbacteria bacterium]|nr:bifunctional 5,10-methylenetetrahydrofolate dehydrogenase/5,10-methenyltetrahydrofolate cyclohydrolase [Candidatus Kaiserbacteria bacterium]